MKWGNPHHAGGHTTERSTGNGGRIRSLETAMVPRNIAFGLIFDNLLNLDLRTTRVRTALYAILYDALAVSDSWLLTNAPLQQMLLAPDGVELLKAGIITPMLRTDMPKLNTRAQVHRDKPGSLHGFNDNPELIQLVDNYCVPRFYEPKDVGANYRRLADRLMQPDALSSNGLSERSVGIIVGRFALALANKEATGTNTFVKDDVCPLLGDESQAAILMDLARAPYSLNLPSLYGQGIVAPENFRGHDILRALFNQGRQVGELLVGAATVSGDFKRNISDRLVGWLLSAETLESLTAAELAMIRSHPDRVAAQVALSSYLASPNAENWVSLADAMERYLKAASNDLFNQRVRQEQVKADPKNSDLTALEGGDHLVTVGNDQSQPMQLADLPQAPTAEPNTAEAIAVQIVGRSGLLPAAVQPPAE